MRNYSFGFVFFSFMFLSFSLNAQMPFEYSFDDGTVIKGTYFNDPGKIPSHMVCISPFNSFMTGQGDFLGYDVQYIFRNDSNKFYSISRVRGGYFGGSNSYDSTPTFEANSFFNLVLLKKDKLKEKKVNIYRKATGSNNYNAYSAILPISKRKTLNVSAGFNFWKYNSDVRMYELEDNVAILKYVGGDLKSFGPSLGFEYVASRSIKVISDHSNFIKYKIFRLYGHLAYGFYNDFRLYEVSHPTWSTSVYTDKKEELSKTLNASVSKISMRLGIDVVRNINNTFGFIYGAELCFIPQYIIENVDVETRSEIGGLTIHVGLTIGNNPW